MWSEIDVPYEAAQARELLAGVYGDLGDAGRRRARARRRREASFERMGAVAPRVVSRASLQGWHDHATAVRTFMFTDIVDSTRLVEMLGDEQWESLLAWHDRTLRACFEAHCRRGDQA